MSLLGVAHWPGIQQVVACRYTRGLGTQPGHAVLEFLPQRQAIQPHGTLTFTFGGTVVVIPRCKVDFGSMRWSTESGQTAVVKIFDRRWAWQTGGRIIGRYNVKRVDGSIDPETQKTPQELARLLLNAMGEQGYDVSQLPNDDRPSVNWEWSHPATELDRLVEKFGCRVCLKIATDRVQIVRPGFGRALPQTDLQTVTQSIDLAEIPDAIEVVCAPVRFQSKLKLRAVGREQSGNIRPINDLSYTPSGGWTTDQSFADLATNSDNRELAQQWVYKAYQVVSQADGSQMVPRFGDVGNIHNIKPIEPYLVETYVDNQGIVRFQDAYIEGVWFNNDTQFNTNLSSGTRYQGEFRIDREDGIVWFPIPVYQVNSGVMSEAELYLTCSYEATHPATRTPLRFFYNHNLGGRNGTGPRVERREDIVLTVKQDYTNNTQPNGWQSNEVIVTRDAQNQVKATLYEYGGSQAVYAIYNGIVAIDIDGLVRQVTFKVDSQDKTPKGGAETYASLNSEADPYVPRYNQRRVYRESTREPSRISRQQRFPQP